MNKRVMISVGGTGGHIYPSMALAEQLIEVIPHQNLLFVGGRLEENRYFNRSAFNYRSISCGSFSKNPWSLTQNVAKMGYGVGQSLRIIKDFKPHLAIGFGSYYSFPSLLAAKMASVPFILHEANSIPGKVIRLLSRYAVATGIHFPQAATLLKGEVIEVGMPLRKEYSRSEEGQAIAQDYYGLSAEKPILLVFGGSQGAKVVNQVCSEAILKIKPLQILHFTGDAVMADRLRLHYQRHGISACVKDFEDKMHLAWQVANMVICRSGAGTIAEQLEFEVPGILIPYPHAAENHQEFNADFLVNTVKGGIKLLEKELTADILALAIEKLLPKTVNFRQAMRDYKKCARSRTLFKLVEKVLSEDR